MKIYIYENAPGHLVAVCNDGETDHILADYRYSPTSADDSTSEHAFAVRDMVANYPGGPHDMLWVPDPQNHPELCAILDRLAEPPDDMDALETFFPDCNVCAHAAVCVAKPVLETLGATLSDCPQFIDMTEEE